MATTTTPKPAPDDARPPVWVGHVLLSTPEIEKTWAFCVDVGMRPIEQGDGFGVLELRGGTHLVLLHAADARPGDAGFDLMVEDLEVTHRELRARGVDVSEIEPGEIHSSFVAKSPTGHTITFNSTHVSDRPV